MPLIPSFGQAQQTSDITFLLQDQLDAMGDFLTQEIGSLNWIEAYVNARGLAEDKQYLQLMSAQLSPNSASVFLNRWAQIYGVSGTSNPKTIENYIELKQAQFGTPPILSNLYTFFQDMLGPIFIDLEWRPELQGFATTNPTVQISQDGYAYSSPLSTVMVYVWQPRDNKDNLLMPNSVFNSTVDSYHALIESWNPAYITFETMNLTNRGFQDGYGNNYNGLNYNNYLDGYNVINGTAGSTTITGTNTAFKFYPNGHIGDFQGAINEGFHPPLQVVDDLGNLQTYYVASVSSNTSLILTTPVINNITNRTYRTIGIVTDTPGALDNGMIFNV